MLRSLFYAALLCPALVCAQATPAIAGCFGKDFSAYEALLGTKSEPNEDVTSVARIYRGKRNGCVVLTKDRGAKVVTGVSVLFPRGRITWRSALRAIGVSYAHAHAVDKHGYFVIEGCNGIPKGWMVWWLPKVEAKQDEISLGVPHRMVY